MMRHTDSELVALSLQTGLPVRDLLQRGTGRTFRCALWAIHGASASSGKPYQCTDHVGGYAPAQFRRFLEAMLTRLGCREEYHVENDQRAVHITYKEIV